MMTVLQKYTDTLSDACHSYMRRAAQARSGRQLADVAFSVAAIEYLASKIARGLISPQDIADTLGPFLDGRYVRDLDGYTSAVYLRCPLVTVRTTAALIIHCPHVTVPDGCICELHIVGSSTVDGPGRARVVRHLPDGSTNTQWHGTV